MRIGLVSPYSFDVPGGVNLHVRDLAEYFLAQGHSVSVLAPADEDTPVEPYVVSAGRAVPVPYNGSVARLAFGPLTSARVSRWIDNGNFEVVHVHEPVSPSVSMLAMWAARGPLVATFHTSNERSRALLAAQPVLQPGLERLSARIAVSGDARRFVREHIGGDAVVIPNGVYVDNFANAPVRADWRGTAGRPTIAFLGRMEEPRKGLPVLLAAMPALLAAIPGLRLLIAGPGDPAQVLDGAHPRVAAACEFLGMVSEEDKRTLLRSVEAYIAPNTGGESFGIILIEAMSAGAPVVASDISAFEAVLEQGRCGALFRNEDSKDLVRAIHRVLRDPQEQEQLAQLGRERAARFDWSRVAVEVMNVYETVLDTTTQPAVRSRRSTARWMRGGRR